MKICYIAPEGIHTKRWVEYFAERGHEIHLITLMAEDIQSAKIYPIKTKAPKLSPLFKAIRIRNLVKKIKPDILHAHEVVPFGLYGALSGFHPFVVTAWGSDVLICPKESKIMKYAVPFTLRRADIITCDGENTKEAMIKMGIENKKINIIMHGVDIKKFGFSCGDEELREELAIFDSPTVISTRRLGVIYDVGTLIKSIPLVLKEFADAKFIIAGEGEQKEYLMNLAKSLKVFDATRFVGWIPNDKLPKYLASSDVYVSTSLSDSGLSAGTAEAMACGLPVVITDFGDNRKWVEDGVNGFIVPLKDPKALAEKIIYLLKNPDIRKEFGMRNRRIIEERNNYYKEMEKMEKIYIELVERYKS